MCDNVDTCPFEFDSSPDQYTTQEMCDKVASKEPFMLTKYYLDESNKAQEMCDKMSADTKICSWLVCCEQNAWKSWGYCFLLWWYWW